MNEAKKTARDTPLSVGIENDQLVVRIGIDTLAFCAQPENGGPVLDTQTLACRVDSRRARQWAKDVVREMTDEAENGDTPLCKFLDKMMCSAAENGSMAIHYKKKKKKGVGA